MRASFVPLGSGEPIGVVALSGPVDRARLEAGLTVIRGWAHPVIVADNVCRVSGYLAGSDEQRLAGVEEVVRQGARWLVAARGGFGATRLLNTIDLASLAKRQIAFVGFSDLTAVTNPLAGRGCAQVHGPMVAAGLDRRRNASRLLDLLEGRLVGETLFRFRAPSVVRHGAVRGHAIGGNLALMTTLIGTPWEPDFDGALLFLEDVDEPLFRLDRMLTHLRTSGRLRHVKALIGGSLRGCRPASDRVRVWRQLLAEAAPEGAPVVVDLDFGHGAANLAFPIGVELELDTRSGRLVWS
ncbi:MAG: LD-carboxypeptidase [Holophagae bacterium]|jgi:muramoyltetrapeptide carboxypeptidase